MSALHNRLSSSFQGQIRKIDGKLPRSKHDAIAANIPLFNNNNNNNNSNNK